MKVQVCNGNSCKKNFSNYILDRLERDKEFYADCDNIFIEEVNCLGNCEKGPSIKIDKELYSKMTPAKASELVFKNKKKKENENI